MTFYSERLTPPTFLPGKRDFSHRLARADAKAFVRALQEDFGMWEDRGGTFAAYQLEELTSLLTSAIPGEYWFTAPEVRDAKLLFNPSTGFSLLVQNGSALKHREAKELNRLFSVTRYAR